MTDPRYETIHMTEEQWLRDRPNIEASQGWEWKFVVSRGEVTVYLRRHLSGPLSTETEGWMSQ